MISSPFSRGRICGGGVQSLPASIDCPHTRSAGNHKSQAGICKIASLSACVTRRRGRSRCCARRILCVCPCLCDRAVSVSQGPDRALIIVEGKWKSTSLSRCRTGAQHTYGARCHLRRVGGSVWHWRRHGWQRMHGGTTVRMLGAGRVARRRGRHGGGALCPMGARAEPTKGPFIVLGLLRMPAQW